MEQSKTGLAAIFAAIIVMMGCNTMDNNHTRRPQNGEPLPYHELVEPRLLSYKGGHLFVFSIGNSAQRISGVNWEENMQTKMLTVFGIVPTKGSDVFLPIPNLFYTEKGEPALYIAGDLDGLSYVYNEVISEIPRRGAYSGKLIKTPPDLSKPDPFL